MKSATILLLELTVLTGLPHQSSAAPQLGSQIENLVRKIGSGVAGKADESVDKGVGAAGGTGKRMSSGNAGKPSGGTDVSLIFDQAAKYIETVKVTPAELTRKLETVKGAAKVKAEEAIAKVGAHLKQVESIVAMIVKGPEVTAKTAEKLKIPFLQVEEKIKADLAELRTVIEGILQKGGKEVSSVVLTAKSNVAKVTQDFDIILSQLSKALEAVLTKTNGAIVNTDHEFKSLFAKLIEGWKAAIGRIVQVVQSALATATGAQKEGLFKVGTFLEGFKGLAYAKLAGGDIIGNKNLLEDLKARITKVVCSKAAVPKLLAIHGGTAVGAILKDETTSIIKPAKPFLQLISRFLPCKSVNTAA